MKRIIDFFRKVHEFLLEWNEAYLLIFTICFWPITCILIRLIDPTAGTFDAGVIHVVYVIALIFGALHLFIWIGIRLNYPKLWEYFQGPIVNDFTSITPWERLKLSFAYLCLYLALVVLLAIQLI